MIEINKDIRDQFDLFRELLDADKTIRTKTIQLEPKRNNTVWLLGRSSIIHKTITEDIELIVERSKRTSKYGVKLCCPYLTNEPFFRFDSDGPAHRNNFPEIPLEEQSVETPHFNSYREDGRPFAYKNDTLKNANEALQITADINFGISLFCMESNSFLVDGDFPTVIDKEPELDFGGMEKINFSSINFE